MRKVVIATMTVFMFSGCSGQQPGNLGVMNGELAPCPDSPNCVSSLETREQFHIAPILYLDTKRNIAIPALLETLKSERGCSVKTEQQNYLHVECRSTVMGFIDDVEFYFPENIQQIEVRSASRIGYYDFGVNRNRIERIRDAFSRKISP